MNVLLHYYYLGLGLSSLMTLLQLINRFNFVLSTADHSPSWVPAVTPKPLAFDAVKVMTAFTFQAINCTFGYIMEVPIKHY